MNLKEKLEWAKQKGFEMIVFNSLEELGRHFEERGNYNPEGLKRFLEHEKEHYDKAVELGVNVVYTIMYYRGNLAGGGCTIVEDANSIPIEVKRKILSAPKRLSRGDIIKLRKLEREAKQK